MDSNRLVEKLNKKNQGKIKIKKMVQKMKRMLEIDIERSVDYLDTARFN